MKSYKNLFIDLDDTIWDFTNNSRKVYKTLYDKYNYNQFFPSFEKYIEIFEQKNEELWSEYGKGEITKEELNLKRFSYPLEKAGVFNQELAIRYMEDSLSMMPTMQGVVDGAIETLEYLYPKYNLYILSNGFRELQSRKMRSAGIDKYFKKIILSEDLNIHKPHIEIFHFALSATQSELNNSIMIGDNIDTDIKGAANSGIDQIYLNRWDKKVIDFKPTYTIKKLTELKNIL